MVMQKKSSNICCLDNMDKGMLQYSKTTEYLISLSYLKRSSSPVAECGKYHQLHLLPSPDQKLNPNAFPCYWRRPVAFGILLNFFNKKFLAIQRVREYMLIKYLFLVKKDITKRNKDAQFRSKKPQKKHLMYSYIKMFEQVWF